MKNTLINLTSLFLIFASSSCDNQNATSINAENTSEIEPIKKHILTPSTVESERLGTLSYFDGYPSAETVQKLYDNLDFNRGIEAFLNGIPAASMQALLEGFKGAGVDEIGEFGIFGQLLYTTLKQEVCWRPTIHTQV